jgi:hypothetical protein
MQRRLFLIFGALVGLSGCVSSPKQTVLNLDTTDPRWTSRACVVARKAVARYDDHPVARGVLGTLGNLAVPFAGSATSLAWSAAQDPRRKALNRRVRAACISDPLGERRARLDEQERPREP